MAAASARNRQNTGPRSPPTAAEEPTDKPRCLQHKADHPLGHLAHRPEAQPNKNKEQNHLIMDPEMDNSAHKSNNATYLKKVLHTVELFDAWRYLHANEKDYTFFSHRHCSYSRIDMFLTDKWSLQKNSVHADL